jgi:glycosyltransferase involved in cell wall biosynthesis
MSAINALVAFVFGTLTAPGGHPGTVPARESSDLPVARQYNSTTKDPAADVGQDPQPRVPAFSVIIPLYQKRHRIGPCLDSVLAQTHPALEVLVVDDGSTDGGGEVVKAMATDRVHYVQQVNQGASAARNHGLRLAKGSYVAFLDADDTWEDGHLAALAGLAQRHPSATILGTGWSQSGSPVRDPELGEGDTVVDVRTFLRRASAGLPPFWTSAVALRRSALPTTDLFPVGSRVAEDQHAWLTLLEVGPGVRGDEITADYFLDEVHPTVARPHADDFTSVIFADWGTRKGADYRRFVTGHRLYTIERHIGHTPTLVLLGHLLRTGRPFQPVRRLRILARLLRHELQRAAAWRPRRTSRTTVAGGGE